VLPEACLVQHGGSAWLTTNELFEEPSRPATARPNPASPAQLKPELPTLSRAAWQSLVESTAASIRAGEAGLRKVVLARAQQVRSEQPFDVPSALRWLAEAYPTCTIFAFGDAERTFLGASPERLVNVHNGLASSMALAGTIRRGESEAEDAALACQLLQDPKERSEHAFVVDALRDSFSGLCTRVIVDGEPRVERFPNVQHLLTRVHGQVRGGVGALDLVQAVHPTPAMGGSPRAAALERIRDRERLDRGWYSGAFGWLDARGDGEFVVAIRSALVTSRTATLFAGCGIVADSDAPAEYAESELKLRPMLAALHPTAA
jgi:isochorismate synthase